MASVNESELNPEKNWLTVEEKIEFGLDAQADFYWGKGKKTIHSSDHRIVKRTDVSSEQQRARALKQRPMSKSEKAAAERLIREELDKAWSECTEREKILAEKFVTGSSADRKVWGDYVVKRKGTASEGGIDVLPLDMPQETLDAMLAGLELIKELQIERDQHRIDLLDRLAEEELDPDGDLGDTDITGEDTDNCPF